MNRIRNFIQLTENVGTSGQPTIEQFDLIADYGYKAVINLALPDSDDAIANEGNIVTSLGMTYLHIPVPFDHPTIGHLRTFVKAMDVFEENKVWVHCVMNYRVSAFMYQYLRLRKRYSEEQARSTMFDTWEPDAIWTKFINLRADDVGL